MNDDKLIITRNDGSTSEIENPFEAMQSTYEALAADPNAMPELSDESRAEILAQIEREKRLAHSAELEKQWKEELEEKERDRREGGRIMNRHERRKAAKLARRK